MPSHEQELEGYILQGMARAIWVHAFTQWATEVDLHVDRDTWEEEADETPPAAMEAAQNLATGIQKMNASTVAAMFLALRGHLRPRHSEMRATEADRAFSFGGDVALACLGTLDVPELARYNLPEMKTDIELDKRQQMELSWEVSGDETPARNPARWAHSDVQSLLFSKERYTVSQAKRWAQDHGFKYGSVDEGHGDFIHLRQFAPEYGRPCATVDFGHGIEARVCSTRNPSGSATLWAVLANGRRHWEPGSTSEEALEVARRSHGQHARLETGPNGEPIRTGECEPARKRRGPAKATRATPVAVRAMSIEEFAQAVKHDIVPTVSGSLGPNRRAQGRFGDKVFIAAAYRASQRDQRFQGMSLQRFKEMLAESARERLLDLARADLVGAMEQAEVAESEYKPDPFWEVHFIEDRIGEPYYPGQ